MSFARLSLFYLAGCLLATGVGLLFLDRRTEAQ